MKKWIVVLCVLVAIGAAGTFYYRKTKPAGASSSLITAALARGNVVEAVQSTGTLEAVTTVQVGTQVSGTIKALHADFNSQVRQGQVVAELEQSLFQAQVEQASATLTRLQADRDRARVQVEDAQIKLKRARELSARQLLPTSDLDTAESTARQAEASLKSAEAQIVQARASLNQNQVNLSYTVIKAPIDGIVVSRNVDVGQTVAASMQAPTLFVLAKDLAEMQVSAAIDESDIGRIHPGQSVTFKVDAYPDDIFTGTVRQVRLQPVVTQNVVSYTTIITVPNPTLKLRPGMTANVTVEISRAENVLRIPAAALRFRPTPELFASLGQPAPAAGFGGFGGGRGAAGPAGGPPATASQPGVPATSGPTGRPGTAVAPDGGRGAGGTAAPSGGGGGPRGSNLSPEEREAFRQRMQNASPEERQRLREERRSAGGGPSAPPGAEQGGPGAAGGGTGAGPGGGRFANLSPEERAAFRERMQNMSPEERDAFRQRMREGGPPAGGGAPAGGRAGADRGASAKTPGAGSRRPVVGGRNGAPGEVPFAAAEPPRVTTRAVWLLRDGKLERAVVRVSVSDGAALALVEGSVNEGDLVVTGVAQPTAQAPGAGNPLMPFGGRFPGAPGGNFGGGGAARTTGGGAARGGAGR